jgi:hypothetical protein
MWVVSVFFSWIIMVQLIPHVRYTVGSSASTPRRSSSVVIIEMVVKHTSNAWIFKAQYCIGLSAQNKVVYAGAGLIYAVLVTSMDLVEK